MLLGDDTTEGTMPGGPSESLVREAPPSLVVDADVRRFRWRVLWPIGDRLRAYFDTKPRRDFAAAWRDVYLTDAWRTARTIVGDAERPSSDILAIVGLQFEARILANQSIPAVLLGPDASAPAAKLCSANRGVVSFGICGGLAPGLRAGACIVASCIHDGRQIWRTDEAWSRRLCEAIPGAVVAPILGVDAPIIGIAEKSRLHEEFGAAVVDMESHLAAAAASAHRLPFVAIRVVADDARCGLPDAALVGRRADGSIDAPAVLRALFDNPSDLAPLIRLAAQTRLARAKLLSLSQSLGDRMCLPLL